MSSSGPRREVAYRVFADEFNDATHTYAESDEERAPNYLVTPTGARVNRLFVVGVLTEVEEVSDDVVRARVVDPTGAFVIYAGQYQPDALAFFERADPPAFVAVTGKARTFQPEGSDRVFTSLRPETVNQVDAQTRDRWVVQTAEHTLERIAIFAKALASSLEGQELEEALATASVRPGIAAGIPRAIEAYGTTTGYLASIQSLAIDAARLVADEVDAVEREPLAPDEGGDAAVDTSFAADVVLEPPADREATTEETPASATSDRGSETETRPEEPAEADADSREDSREPEEGEREPQAGSEEGAAVEPEGEQPSPGEEEQPPAAVREEGAGTKTEPEAQENAEMEAEAEDEAKAETDPEATDEMYELSEAEREEVKEKYDVGFESGAEIGEPGSASGDLEAETPAEPGVDEGAVESEAVSDESEGEAVVGEDEAETEAVSEDLESKAALGAEESDVESDAAETTEPGEEAIEEASIQEETPADEMADEEPADESEAEMESGAAPLSSDELEDVVIETMKAEAGQDGIDRGELVEAVQAEYGIAEDEVEAAIQDALLGGRCFESGEDRLKPI